MELTYTKVGDYYIPDLTLGDQPDKPLGKYGRMRQQFLKEYHPGTYNRLILSGKLWAHLVETNTTCNQRPAQGQSPVLSGRVLLLVRRRSFGGTLWERLAPAVATSVRLN